MSNSRVTSSDEALAVLEALAAAGVTVWVAGGWGVDALVGEQTRPHGDLDLVVPREQSPLAAARLETLGYRLAVDERPTRFVLRGPGGAEVDVHPIELRDDGSALLPGPAGIVFVFPPGSLEGAGCIAGRAVRCLTVQHQLTVHRGYDPRPHDVLDIARLQGLLDRDGRGDPPREPHSAIDKGP